MVDVLELARDRRAELIAELETLDWFLKKAETLLREHYEKTVTPDQALLRPAPVAVAQVEHAQPDSAKKPVLHVSAPDEARAADGYQRPVDTIVFKKMLTEMRRTYQTPNAMPVQEKIASAG